MDFRKIRDYLKIEFNIEDSHIKNLAIDDDNRVELLLIGNETDKKVADLSDAVGFFFEYSWKHLVFLYIKEFNERHGTNI